MALQPWTAPPVPGEGGDDPASALVTTATGQVVTAAEYERRVKEVRVGAIGEGSAARGACVCVGPHSMRAHSVPRCGVPGRPLPEAAGAREGKRREGWGARNSVRPSTSPPRPPPLPSPTTLTLFITRTPSSHLSLSLSQADALGEKLKIITESVPTITRNVQGSAAGAGSSTFHIYRLARSQNAAREAALDAAEAAAAAQAGVEARRAAAAAADEARTAKRRAARAKKKGRKRARNEEGGGGGGGGSGGGGGDSSGSDGDAGGGGPAAPAADLD